MRRFYVYLHLKPNGDPFYVGKGLITRSGEFAKRSEHHSRIVAKCGGKRNITVLAFERVSEQDALDTEIVWISVLREAGYKLCNQTDGGDGMSGHSPSVETRTKIAASKIGKPRSAETRLKCSLANTGKIQSAETIAKRVAKISGRACYPATKEKISVAAKERWKRGCYSKFRNRE